MWFAWTVTEHDVPTGGEGSPQERRLTGRLLVATPQVTGDVFARSVILLLHHGDDGAQGVIVNQPTPVSVDTVLDGWEALTSHPGVVFRGGPVQTDSAIGVVTVPGEFSGDLLGVRLLFGQTGVVDLDAPPAVVAAHLGGMRVFAGYSGWAPGQLEGEIARGDWFVVDSEPRDAFVAEPADLWRTVLRRQRDSLQFVAFYPADPELN